MNTFRIIGLTALTLLSIVPLAKPISPTIHVQASSSPVQFVLWTISVSTPSCGGTSFASLDFYNFTENLSGRDPGSTWVKFPATSPPITGAQITFAEIYDSNNLNATTLTVLGKAAVSCTNFPYPTAEMRMQLHTATFYWRTPQTGKYAVFIGNAGPFFNGGGTGPPPLEAVDSWTVTTIV